ncbi:type II toxin-antitoxin system prevent-host-death family antitoxin [Streptomyces sp. NPDC047718]|uniref:type II toxin-antitoxin system Phd/YefM family antitoxin n=1 Tax=Streptomyces sp. NPDC047718 TaxID=3155479 RepID=UPI0033DA7A9F
MFVTAGAARNGLLPLIKKVNESHEVVEIVSEHGDAVLLSAEDYAALREGSHPFRSGEGAPGDHGVRERVRPRSRVGV